MGGVILDILTALVYNEVSGGYEMKWQTDYFTTTNEKGDFALTEVARCSIGISNSITLILYKGESSDPENDYEFLMLEIVNVADGVNHSQQVLLDPANVAYIANTFKDAAMVV